MSTRRRGLTAAAALLSPLLVIPLAGPAATAAGGPLASSVAVDWQRIAIRTIYTQGGSAPPLGTLYLSFTSLAVYDAALEAQRHGSHAAAAAVATAAHDVLVKYFPATAIAEALDTDLAASLATVPDGPQEDAGVEIGAIAAKKMIASREDDGRFDGSYQYTKTAALGIWPAAGVTGGMSFAWLGFVDPVVDVEVVELDGPDLISSDEYAQDYEEVRTLGAKATSGTVRSADQTAVAQFFSTNPVLMYRNALCNLLDREPLGLVPTTRLFARIDAAVATTVIETWRLKFEEGFWRPAQAIAAGGADGNEATNPHPLLWEPLVVNPAYSDYTSGHASATSPFAEILRQTLGDDTLLELQSTPTGPLWKYETLTALEHDALNARIWGGLHFRDAMEDGYHLGHTTADRVMRAIR